MSCPTIPVSVARLRAVSTSKKSNNSLGLAFGQAPFLFM